MSSVRQVVFSHEIKQDPHPDDAGLIKIKARIFREDHDTLTCTTTSNLEEFIDEDNEESETREILEYFLMESVINSDIIVDAMINLELYVDEVTCSASSQYFPGCSLEVWMDFLPYDLDDPQIEEAVQASFDQTNNIPFRPASKVVVNSLPRKIYNKISSTGENCTVCLEEFNDGTRVVTLPCGHEFDDDCIVTWFETSHVCPLCRFELPCEGQ